MGIAHINTLESGQTKDFLDQQVVSESVRIHLSRTINFTQPVISGRRHMSGIVFPTKFKSTPLEVLPVRRDSGEQLELGDSHFEVKKQHLLRFESEGKLM